MINFVDHLFLLVRKALAIILVRDLSVVVRPVHVLELFAPEGHSDYRSKQADRKKQVLFPVLNIACRYSLGVAFPSNLHHFLVRKGGDQREWL